MTMMSRSVETPANVWVVPLCDGNAADLRPPATLKRRLYDPVAVVRSTARVLTDGKPGVAPKDAVARFLRDMAAVARKTFPEWRERLVPEIEDCVVDYETRRSLLEVHPLDDYFFAGVVALEAAKIRSLFTPEESAELLGLIADGASEVTGRTDRLVPDLVFAIIVRIAVTVRADNFKRDYDQVCKFLLERMGVDRCAVSRHLMNDICFRHNLGEPMARGMRQWWKTFAGKNALVLAPAGALTTSVASPALSGTRR